MESFESADEPKYTCVWCGHTGPTNKERACEQCGVGFTHHSGLKDAGKNAELQTEVLRSLDQRLDDLIYHIKDIHDMARERGDLTHGVSAERRIIKEATKIDESLPRLGQVQNEEQAECIKGMLYKIEFIKDQGK
ncbi:MAG: hypothetical protein WDZ79_00570 [Candidatus Paceibacterota bacterium]